jgi:hypothetical protein
MADEAPAEGTEGQFLQGSARLPMDQTNGRRDSTRRPAAGAQVRG